MNKFFTILLLVTVLGLGLFSTSSAQTLRNPLLEFCTGINCGFCPAGHAIIHNNIMPAIPNAIVVAYHGFTSDPFDFFPGYQIKSHLGLSAYPTGVIDRVSGVQSRGAWTSHMTARQNVPATVSINVINRNYDPQTRTFTATFDFTALQNLSGQFKYNAVLSEDGIVWYQGGSGGGPNYVHDSLVRAMMNGALGEEVINGTWNAGQTISKNLSYTYPVPTVVPDIIPDSCDLVAWVYQVGSPLNAAAEVQQAEKWTLIAPDFVATMAQTSADVIGDNATIANMQAVIYNEGLMDDKYYLDLQKTVGPAGWTMEYTTANGTFPMGDIDSVAVASGDSAVINVAVNPNGIDGYGIARMEFASKNNPGLYGHVKMRNITNTGLDMLVIDANTGSYVDYLTDGLDRLGENSYGVVSRSALSNPAADLGNFKQIFWSAGESEKAFHPAEVTHLQTFMDAGGELMIMGQDIGNDVFGANATSTHAQSFYTDYLHANFVADASPMFLVKGVAGDPISDGLQFILGAVYDRSLDIITPATSATGCMTYFTAPNWGAIHAETSLYRMIYMTFSLEQVDQIATRDTILGRSLNWLNGAPVGIDNVENMINEYQLNQNYPNPFNPTTKIQYVLNHAGMEKTSLVIYNSLGQKVRTLVNEQQSAKMYNVKWDGKDDFGTAVASGIYYYQLQSGAFNSVKKMVLMK